jgi:hypothetical protein
MGNKYIRHKQAFISSRTPVLLDELQEAVSTIDQDYDGLELGIETILVRVSDFVEDAEGAIRLDRAARLLAEKRECVRVCWSDGIYTLISGSDITQELKDHIAWRTERYASKGEDLTFRIETGDRRELLK